MAQTQHFGLERFASEGRLSDEGYKFTGRDRDTLDNLLYRLFQHDHSDNSGGELQGPNFPIEATVNTTGGTIGANATFWYRIAYKDFEGSETYASPAMSISTAAALAAPPVMALTAATTGGTLAGGTYKYALSYYQNSGGQTAATNIATTVLTAGTTTGEITVTLNALPSTADGWKVYRKAPGEVQYYLLKTVASGATEYVDDGSDSPNCSITRPTSNTTNATNSITLSINSNDLPLDSRIVSWRIYRSATASFGENSLLATQTETTTEGGSDLVTTYLDTGGSGQYGTPLTQSVVPPAIPQLDAGDALSATGKRLNALLAPVGVHTWDTFMAGTLADSTIYNQTVPPYDMNVKRIDVFFQTGPTGVDGSNYVTVQVADDALIDEIQSIYTDTIPVNEIQNISNNATGGTFTLSFDGQGPTNDLEFDAPVIAIKEVQSLYNNATSGTFTLGDGTDTTSNINYNDSAATIKTRLETDITAITTVTVTGAGTSGNPWIITFDDPIGPFGVLTVTDSLGPSASSTIAVTTAGRYGVETELEKLSNITDVDVFGDGTAANPWVIEFLDPGSEDVAQITADDTNLTGGTTSISTAVQGSDGGTFTLSDGVDTTSAIAWDAADATIETRLETDITSITDVDVSGSGTAADPWLVTFLNPGDQDVPLLIGNNSGLANGASVFVEEVVEGSGITTIDVVCDAEEQFFSWISSTDLSGELEAEDGTGGSTVADTLASNDVAVELDTQNEENYWYVGLLEPGDYTAYFYVADFDATSTFDIKVVVDHLGTPSNLASLSVTSARTVYTPAYELKFTSTGVEELFFVVEKTDTGTDRVRIDKYEYELDLPVLSAGYNVTVEALVTGTPTTNGDDAQVTVWY